MDKRNDNNQGGGRKEGEKGTGPHQEKTGAENATVVQNEQNAKNNNGGNGGSSGNEGNRGNSGFRAKNGDFGAGRNRGGSGNGPYRGNAGNGGNGAKNEDFGAGGNRGSGNGPNRGNVNNGGNRGISGQGGYGGNGAKNKGFGAGGNRGSGNSANRGNFENGGNRGQSGSGGYKRATGTEANRSRPENDEKNGDSGNRGGVGMGGTAEPANNGKAVDMRHAQNGGGPKEGNRQRSDSFNSPRPTLPYHKDYDEERDAHKVMGGQKPLMKPSSHPQQAEKAHLSSKQSEAAHASKTSQNQHRGYQGSGTGAGNHHHENTPNHYHGANQYDELSRNSNRIEDGRHCGDDRNPQNTSVRQDIRRVESPNMFLSGNKQDIQETQRRRPEEQYGNLSRRAPNDRDGNRPPQEDRSLQNNTSRHHPSEMNRDVDNQRGYGSSGVCGPQRGQSFHDSRDHYNESSQHHHMNSNRHAPNDRDGNRPPQEDRSLQNNTSRHHSSEVSRDVDNQRGYESSGVCGPQRGQSFDDSRDQYNKSSQHHHMNSNNTSRHHPSEMRRDVDNQRGYGSSGVCEPQRGQSFHDSRDQYNKSSQHHHMNSSRHAPNDRDGNRPPQEDCSLQNNTLRHHSNEVSRDVDNQRGYGSSGVCVPQRGQSFQESRDHYNESSQQHHMNSMRSNRVEESKGDYPPFDYHYSRPPPPPKPLRSGYTTRSNSPCPDRSNREIQGNSSSQVNNSRPLRAEDTHNSPPLNTRTSTAPRPTTKYPKWGDSSVRQESTPTGAELRQKILEENRVDAANRERDHYKFGFTKMKRMVEELLKGDGVREKLKFADLEAFEEMEECMERYSRYP